MASAKPFSELRLVRILNPLKPYIYQLFAFSLAYNILLFAPIVYMLNIMDKAIQNRSVPTLLTLTTLMIVAFIALGFISWVRELYQQRFSARLYALTHDTAFDISAQQALYNPAGDSGARAMDDLLGLKRLTANNSFMIFLDLPFIPIFMIVMFFFHYWFGLLALAGIAIIVIVAYIDNHHTKSATKQAQKKFADADSYMSRNLANAEVIQSMGMLEQIRNKWSASTREGLASQVQASQLERGLNAFSTTIRMFMSSLTLGMGAYLVINDEITRGMMIAASVLTARVLGPISQFIGNINNYQLALGQWERLVEFFELGSDKPEYTKLPAPEGKLTIEGAIVSPPGQTEPVLKGISFSLQSGAHLGIMGHSGAGKSTLARACLGLWPCNRGSIRLDGADLFQWEREDIGQYIGYLPQNVELLDGSISDNIARLQTWESEDVVSAAKMAGVHELILQQPQGYDTQVSMRSGQLSGGELQRIGLARALYGNPKFVVLDEPHTNLDQEGEQALVECIHRLKEARVTVILIAHSPVMLACMDNLMVLHDGRIADFGKTEKLLAKYRPQKAIDLDAVEDHNDE